MSQQRPNKLVLLSIEKEMSNKIDYNSLRNDFFHLKIFDG